MKNIEKYKDIVLDNVDACSIDARLRGMNVSAYCEGYNCERCEERFLKWLLEEYKEPILDDVEKAYLTSVIKPFRKKVNSITKILVCDSKKCFIRIRVNNTEHVNLPNFNIASGMYAGMRSFRVYTLEELGL